MSMNVKKVLKQMQIEDVKTNLFVRKELDHDRVLWFAQLIENGEVIIPIEVTCEGEMADGRHRLEAYRFHEKKIIEVYEINITDPVELIAYAFRANTGGALPPTQADIEHTIAQLVEKGENNKQISELLGIPAGIVRKLVIEVKSKLKKARVQRAASAVAEGGLTVAKAAEQYGADLDDVKEIISGRRLKARSNGVNEMKRTVTKKVRSISQSVSKMFKGLNEKFEDGDVSEKQATDIYRSALKSIKSSIRTVEEWQNRFNVLAGRTKVIKKSA